MNQPRPIKALIADDDPTSTLMLEWLGVSLNLQIFTATDVVTAKRLVTEIAPQIAVLDVMLPDGDGVDILHHIHNARIETAVAIISASLNEFPFHKCGKVRPDIIFSKPLDGEAIRAWFEKQVARLEGCNDPGEKLRIG
jgi:two-component system, NtrC family, response regulator PilR